jgi:hypothetical protein
VYKVNYISTIAYTVTVTLRKPLLLIVEPHGLMVSVFASSVVDCEFEPWSNLRL